MKANLRKCAGLLAAILLYYVVHEGAHLLLALTFGVFREIRFIGLGVQVAITDPGLLNDFQFAVFNVAGAAASLTTAYILTAFAGRICRGGSRLLRAACYYATVLLLLNDPVYLSVLCGFFGGGDMNGIVMFGIPEGAARLLFGMIGLVNLYLIATYVYPVYKKSFADDMVKI